MKNKDIINRLKSEAKVPDVLDKIKASPNFYVPEPNKRKFIIPKVRYAFLSLIIVLALLISPRLTQVEATLTVDINPSVQFDINKNEKVLNLTANNIDGEALIEDIKYKGKNMSDVIDLLIEEAINKKYITEDDYILIGVESDNEEFSDSLAIKVNDKVKSKLLEKNKNAEVVIEKIKKEKSNNKDNQNSTDKKEDTINLKLTDSKRNLIEELISISDYTEDDINELASWKIKDLYDMINEEYIKQVILKTDYTEDDYKKLSKLKKDKLLDILNNQ